MRQKITDVVIEFMKERDMTHLGYADFGLLQEVWEEAHRRGLTKEVYNNHPANKFVVILNAMDRDKKRFEKGFMLCCGGRGDGGECRVRMFKLKETTQMTKQTNHSQQNKAQKKEGGESNSQCVATPEEMNSTTVTKTADTIQSKIRGSKE